MIDGVCRDSYEATIQNTPVFCTVRSPAHTMGRIRPVSDGEPITCADVKVRQGAPVVADDDGVVAVPKDIAAAVVHRAVRIQAVDRPSRRNGYTKLAARRKRAVVRLRWRCCDAGTTGGLRTGRSDDGEQ